MYIDKVNISVIGDSYVKDKSVIIEKAKIECKDGITAKGLFRLLESLPSFSHQFCGNVSIDIKISTCEEQ